MRTIEDRLAIIYASKIAAQHAERWVAMIVKNRSGLFRYGDNKTFEACFERSEASRR